MIKKTIAFTNYLGEKETGDFYFNLSKGELVMMQMSAIDQQTESFQDKVEKIGKRLQGKALMEMFQEIIELSYGVRSTDGKNFIKKAEHFEEFKSSDAYSELIVELCSSAEGAAAFINGLIPANLRNEVNQEVSKAQTARERSEAQMQGFKKKEEPVVQQVPELPTVVESTVVTEIPQPPSAQDMLNNMSREELEALVRNQSQSALQ